MILNVEMKTFNDLFPDYATFQAKVENVVLADIDVTEGDPVILKQHFQTIFNQLNLAYSDRMIRYSQGVFINHFVRIYAATLPSFLTKLAGFDGDYGVNITTPDMRGAKGTTTLSDTNTTLNDNATSNKPYNAVGSAGSEENDKVFEKQRNAGSHSRELSTNRSATDYIDNIAKLNKANLVFPLLNFVGSFNNLFVQYYSMRYWGDKVW